MAYNLTNIDAVDRIMQEFVDRFAGKAADNAYKNGDETSHRYRSWEYCRKAFLQHKNDIELSDDTIDYLALNLAFYLASWGMYRGSSFLLNLDYTVHKEIVRIVLDPKYGDLFDSDTLIVTDKGREKYLNLLFGDESISGIKSEISCAYGNWHKAVKGDMSLHKYSDSKQSENVSDVLITKVLMGVYGCIPAYDRFFTDGLKMQNIKSAFNRKNVAELLENICDNCDLYNALKGQQEKIELQRKWRCQDQNNVYTFMKIVDMFFWEIGSGYVVTVTKQSKNAPKPKLDSNNLKILERQIIDGTFDKEQNEFTFDNGGVIYKSKNIGSLIMCIYDEYDIKGNMCQREAVKNAIVCAGGLENRWLATTRYTKKLSYSF